MNEEFIPQGYWHYAFEHGPTINSTEFMTENDLIRLTQSMGKVTINYVPAVLSLSQHESK